MLHGVFAVSYRASVRLLELAQSWGLRLATLNLRLESPTRLFMLRRDIVYLGRDGQALALGRPWPWATLALGRSRPGPVGLAIVFMRSDYLHTCSIRLESLAWDLLLESVGSFALGLD